MEATRPIVLSIAGFDPSAGAGLLADCKTFEQHLVYGLGISTAQTLQTEDTFISIRWEKESDILTALETLLSNYDVTVVKIGLVENSDVLKSIVALIHKKNNTIKIVLDTIIKSSSGFDFWKEEVNKELLFEILSNVFLITPNYNEVLHLYPSAEAKESAQQLAQYCNVLLKGGHNEKELGVDYLFSKNSVQKLEATRTDLHAKHGSGCVLSAAIAANLALGVSLEQSCIRAKQYTENFLGSTTTLLGYHHVS